MASRQGRGGEVPALPCAAGKGGRGGEVACGRERDGGDRDKEEGVHVLLLMFFQR